MHSYAMRLRRSCTLRFISSRPCVYTIEIIKMTEPQQASPTLESAASSQTTSPVPSAPNAPRYGTIIPNRIFVGGIAFNTSDAELRNFFSAFGHVRESKIIADRAGVSKGYGFITFETPEEAFRILKEQANSLVFKEKKLNIGQAIRKQPIKYPKDVDPALIPSGMVFHSPGGGYSYTYHNGVAYFNPPDVATTAHPTQASIAAHHHHPQPTQPQYAPYTVPIMLPPPAPHQHYLATSQHQQQYTFQQPQAVRQVSTYSQSAPQYQTQWRWVHAQAPPTGMNGSMLSPLYPNPPQAQGTYYQPQELAEVPLMEPSPAEGTTVVQTSASFSDHVPAQLITRQPYMTTQAEIHQPQPPGYATTYDPTALPPGIVQKVAAPAPAPIPKYPVPSASGKRPIKMPRRGDRAVKTIRTDLPPSSSQCPSPMGYTNVVMAAAPPQRLEDPAMLMSMGMGPPHYGSAAPMGTAQHITGAGDN